MKHIPIATLLLSNLTGMAIAAASPGPVKLSTETIGKLGIALATAHHVALPRPATLYARVLDPLPLLTLDADLLAAQAAASASAAEAKRARALHADGDILSAKAAETASMQASSDQARLMLLRRRLTLEWGSAIGALPAAQRHALMNALAAGRAALVRIDAPRGAGLPGLHLAKLDMGAFGDATAVVLGPARSGDMSMQSPGLLARVSGANASHLSVGLLVPAQIAGATPGSGMAVPRTAVIRADGASWVYVRDRAGFTRHRLTGLVDGPGGLVAAGGIRDGDVIAVRGAAKLYAAEHGGGPAED